MTPLRRWLDFQRSLALTTHLVIHGEIKTQAPSVSGFEIFFPPTQEGSWKARAIIAFGAAATILSAGRDSPLGHVVTSIYDAALYNVMGFHVDYEKTIQEQYADYLAERKITAEKIDSLCEKIEARFASMHRPIVIPKKLPHQLKKSCDEKRVYFEPDMSL